MKKIFLILVFLGFSKTALSDCLPPAPPGWGGWYPIQVEYWGWSGTMLPSFFNKTVTIKNADGSLLGTYPYTNFTSDCSVSSPWAEFQIPNIGDGNTWVLLEKFSGYNNWRDSVLWYGVVYSRTN